MPRPPRCRRICGAPQVDTFCPNGGEDVEPILLTLNGYEVIRLVAEAERTGSDTIRMTHEQIAQYISSAREVVARMLKSFSEDGWWS